MFQIFNFCEAYQIFDEFSSYVGVYQRHIFLIVRNLSPLLNQFYNIMIYASIAVLGLLASASGKTYFKESFDDKAWETRWTTSEAKVSSLVPTDDLVYICNYLIAMSFTSYPIRAISVSSNG